MDSENIQEKLLCGICGEDGNDEVFHKTKCGHVFHYNCLYMSFKIMKNNLCPYCRSKKNVLPIVSGLKKINANLHFNNGNTNSNDYKIYKEYKLQKCNHILTKGKNKGCKCTKNCKLGYNYCTQHYKNYIKDEEQILV